MTERPLFEDPDESWERDCQWSYPKVVGVDWPDNGTPKPDLFRDFSNRYFQAMLAVCGTVSDNSVEDYVVGFPIIFLFRHSVELALKAAIFEQQDGGKTALKELQKSKGLHSLRGLMGKVYGIPVWARQWIEELHQLDQKSTALRYPDSEVGFFEAGSKMSDWLHKTEMLQNTLITVTHQQTGSRN